MYSYSYLFPFILSVKHNNYKANTFQTTQNNGTKFVAIQTNGWERRRGVKMKTASVLTLNDCLYVCMHANYPHYPHSAETKMLYLKTKQTKILEIGMTFHQAKNRDIRKLLNN